MSTRKAQRAQRKSYINNKFLGEHRVKHRELGGKINHNEHKEGTKNTRKSYINNKFLGEHRVKHRELGGKINHNEHKEGTKNTRKIT